MYVQHPYKYDGKYYASIDGQMIEISKEVAMAMHSDYRKQIYRSRKWAPDAEEVQEEDYLTEEMSELSEEDNQFDDVDSENKNKRKKWKRKVKYTELLDCAFSENAEGIGVGDLVDNTQMSVEEMVILREESQELHEKLGQLTEQEQFLIKSIYFDGKTVTEMAGILGVSKGRISQKVSSILKKMRRMLETDSL